MNALAQARGHCHDMMTYDVEGKRPWLNKGGIHLCLLICLFLTGPGINVVKALPGVRHPLQGVLAAVLQLHFQACRMWCPNSQGCFTIWVNDDAHGNAIQWARALQAAVWGKPSTLRYHIGCNCSQLSCCAPPQVACCLLYPGGANRSHALACWKGWLVAGMQSSKRRLPSHRSQGPCARTAGRQTLCKRRHLRQQLWVSSTFSLIQ